MLTATPSRPRTAAVNVDARRIARLVAAGSGVLITIAAATGAAIVLAGTAQGLGQFVLVFALWLTMISASPDLAGRVVARLVDNDPGRRPSRSSRAVSAIVTQHRSE